MLCSGSGVMSVAPGSSGSVFESSQSIVGPAAARSNGSSVEPDRAVVGTESDGASLIVEPPDRSTVAVHVISQGCGHVISHVEPAVSGLLGADRCCRVAVPLGRLRNGIVLRTRSAERYESAILAL